MINRDKQDMTGYGVLFPFILLSSCLSLLICCVRVVVVEITNPEVLDKFVARQRDAAEAVRRWRMRVERSSWRTPHDVRLQTSDVSILVNRRLVFNIKGNHYRLVAEVDYRKQSVSIRFIGTHARYDKINAEEV